MRAPARAPAGRWARGLAVLLLVVVLAPPATAAKPRCLGKIATKVGTSGDDTMEGTAQADVFVGRGGNDSIAGYAGNDLVCGGPGDDFLLGVEGRDRLAGGAGDDQLFGGPGNDALDGGPGTFDFANYVFSPSGVLVDLTAGTASGGEGADTLKGIENVFASEYDDELTGSDGSNVFKPLGGNDEVDGRDGLDLVYDGVSPLSSGTDGDDVLDGGDGLDAVVYSESPNPVTANLATRSASGNGADTIEGMEGIWGSPHDDVLTGDSARNLLLPYLGDDQVDGGGANDAAAFWFSQGPVSADLSTGSATGEGTDQLAGIEGLLGSVQFNDVLRGNDQTNLLDGDGADDQLFGEGGDDWLVGGLGNDQIDGGDGEGDLTDFSTTAFFLEVTAAVTVSLDAGTATGQGSDSLTGIEQIYGSELSDSLTGDSGSNVLFGLGGNDSIFGLGGDDSIDAGLGSDDADCGPGTDQSVNAERKPNCEGANLPPHHPALLDAKVLEDYRRNFRRNF